MVGEWALSGAPLASGGMQAWQSQIDATTEHPAGLGPWLPYSESKPAARARGGHPLIWLFIFFTKLETHLAVVKLYFFFKLKGGFQVGANPPTHSECYIVSLN